MAAALSSKSSMTLSRRPTVARRVARKPVVQTKAVLTPMMAIGGSTVAMLTLVSAFTESNYIEILLLTGY